MQQRGSCKFLVSAAAFLDDLGSDVRIFHIVQIARDCPEAEESNFTPSSSKTCFNCQKEGHVRRSELDLLLRLDVRADTRLVVRSLETVLTHRRLTVLVGFLLDEPRFVTTARRKAMYVATASLRCCTTASLMSIYRHSFFF